MVMSAYAGTSSFYVGSVEKGIGGVEGILTNKKYERGDI